MCVREVGCHFYTEARYNLQTRGSLNLGLSVTAHDRKRCELLPTQMGIPLCPRPADCWQTRNAGGFITANFINELKEWARDEIPDCKLFVILCTVTEKLKSPVCSEMNQV